MAKRKNKKNKIKQATNITSKTAGMSNNTTAVIATKFKPYQPLITSITLVFIFLFAVFLRIENFDTWQKNPQIFKYQGEYQMANFDSYFYLQFAKDLQADNYTVIDEKLKVPNGVKRPTIPPLLSLLTANISSITQLPLATVAIFMPVFLSSLLAFVVFFLGRQLGLNNITGLIAAFFSIICIAYIQRTRLGIFDTDSLNVVFTMLNSYLFMYFALNKHNRRYLFLALGVINTALYFIWWESATSVVIFSALIPLSVAIIFFYQTKNITTKYYFLGVIVLGSLALLNKEIVTYIALVFNQIHNVFPLGSVIAELQVVDIKEFIKNTGNSNIIFVMSIIGLGYLVKQNKIKVLFITAPIVLGLLPFIAGSRFMIFSVPILALGLGYFVQLLFDFKHKINIISVYVISGFIIFWSVYNNYHYITYKTGKPAALDNKHLLNALEYYTPKTANIWTDWGLGHQINYYLARGSFADAKFRGGELFYYVNFPLAANNLALSANFMRFYANKGQKGMQKLYQIFGTEALAFEFLQQILTLKPAQATKILTKKIAAKQLNTGTLTTVEDWLSFLYPPQQTTLYLLLHKHMLSIPSWFTQGNFDLKTGKNKALAFFLPFENLHEQGNYIKNKQIQVDKKTGIGTYINGTKYAYQHISSSDGIQSNQYYPKQYTQNKQFVFEWHKKLGYGAMMSAAVADTTFSKLFIHQPKSKYFHPISLKTPSYQIWQVFGDVYR